MAMCEQNSYDYEYELGKSISIIDHAWNLLLSPGFVAIVPPFYFIFLKLIINY